MKDLILFFADVVFGFLKGKDENKHKRIMALIIICLLVPPTILYSLSVYQRFQWFQHHPNSGYVNSLAPAVPAEVAPEAGK